MSSTADRDIVDRVNCTELEHHDPTPTTQPIIKEEPATNTESTVVTSCSTDRDINSHIPQATPSDHTSLGNSTLVNDSTLGRGVKRDSDALFVDEDEELSQPNDRSKKRPKATASNDLDLIGKLILDDGGNVAPYNPDSEARPRYAIYHPDFSKTEQLVTQTVTQFLTEYAKVKENGFHNEQIDRICDSIDKQYRVPLVNYPSVQPVACLGPAGVGKSSTINSILHQRGAAAESDSSQRGTNLIHEFSAAPATQMARFVVAACYFSDRQIENLVVTHCDNIFAYLKQREIEGDDEDAEDDEESRRPYDAAIDLFRILLPHLGEFETNDRAEEYFDANVAKKDHVKQEVYKCIINVKQSRNLDQGIEYFEAQNAKELAEVFRQVSGVAKSANTRSKASHPWPIIRKVEVRLDHALLDAGLVIADTPGITDSNQVVVNTTTNYIKMAGTILLFESIKRLSHSATLDSNLRELIRLGKVRETIIVVTGIDHLTVADENREELSGLHRDALEEAEVMVIDLKKKEKETQDALFSSSMQSTAGTPEFQKLMKDFQDMPKNVALAEARLSQVMMEIKIALALADLDDKLKKLNLSRYRTDLSVMFISNQEYQNHLAGYELRKCPKLTVDGTGIVSLRERLFAVPARGRGHTLRKICRTSLPTRLSSIVGILTKSPLKRQQEVAQSLISALSNRSGIVDVLVDDLRMVFEGQFLEYLESHNKKWENRAAKLIGDWEQYKAGTFLAFCRRGGIWRLPENKKKEIDWTGLVQDVHANQVAAAFDRFEVQVEAMEANMIANTIDMFKRLQTELDDNQDFQGVEGKDLFIDFVRRTSDATATKFAGLFETMHVELGEIRHAFVIPFLQSYVGEGMAEAYKECMGISKVDGQTKAGKRKVSRNSTMHARRVELMQQTLSGNGDKPSVFRNATRLAKDDFEEKLARWQKGFARTIGRACDKVIADFNNRFSVAEDEEVANEDPEAVEKVKRAASAALEVIDGPMKEMIDGLHDFENRGR